MVRYRKKSSVCTSHDQRGLRNSGNSLRKCITPAGRGNSLVRVNIHRDVRCQERRQWGMYLPAAASAVTESRGERESLFNLCQGRLVTRTGRYDQSSPVYEVHVDSSRRSAHQIRRIISNWPVRMEPYCALSRTTIELRPVAFASYNASSASCTAPCTVRPIAGSTIATPTLEVT
jgi:hypothetical protein